MQNGFVFGDRGLGASGDTHPLWALGHALAGSYLVAGASTVGQIHLAHELPRDDAFMVRSLGPWLAIGVADGVGSRPLSRYGATYAVEALTALLLRPFAAPLSDLRTSQRTPSGQPKPADLAPLTFIEDAELKVPFVGQRQVRRRMAQFGTRARRWPRWLRQQLGSAESAPSTTLQQAASLGWWLPASSEQSHAHEPSAAADLVGVMDKAFEKTHLGMRDHAQHLGVDLADLSCTALALLFNYEHGFGVAGQIGDGAILGLTAHGAVAELVEAPDTGDPQATYTVNRPSFQKHLAIQTFQPEPTFTSFYLMTDGLAGDLLFSPQQAALRDWAQSVQGNLRQATSPAQAAAGMLHWLATYEVTGSWDDRTLVVITQREPNI